jgi:hypothetical protein
MNICNLPSIVNLAGLSSLRYVGGILGIWTNPALTNLDGIESLNYIGNGLKIKDNGTLQNINSLLSVTHLISVLVEDNDSLTSLSGLDSLDHNVIKGLEIAGNYSLSTCSVKGICDYLSQPISYNIYISDNALGCNSFSEVHSGCLLLNINEIESHPTIRVYPNPATNAIAIASGSDSVIGEVSIYSITGKRILHLTDSGSAIDVSSLQGGVYILEIDTGTKKFIKKLIIQ